MTLPRLRSDAVIEILSERAFPFTVLVDGTGVYPSASCFPDHVLFSVSVTSLWVGSSVKADRAVGTELIVMNPELLVNWLVVVGIVAS